MDKYALIEEALRAVNLGVPIGADRFRPDTRRNDKDHGSTTSSVAWLMRKSPRLALARAMGIDFVPYPFTITAKISSNPGGGGGSTVTNNNVGNKGPSVQIDQQTQQGTYGFVGTAGAGLAPKQIERDVLIYNMDVDVQAPGASYDELNSLSTYFFALTSGMNVNFSVWGKQERIVRSGKLRALSKMCSPDEPFVMLEEQQYSMNFDVGPTALPNLPIVITVTFVGKTPATDDTFRISQGDALDCLERLGYPVSADTRSTWLDTL
jgi:hypothetical protein